MGCRRVAMFRYPRERDFVVVTFEQDYRSDGLSNAMQKRQYWVEGRRALENHLRRSRMKLQIPVCCSPPPPSCRRALSPPIRRSTCKTNLGTIRLELYPAKAPKTVENFLQYVKDGHYNGTVFHRVIDGFMIQGGGFDDDFRHEPEDPRRSRNEAQIESKNGLKNDVGTHRHGAHQPIRTRRPRSSSSTSTTTTSSTGTRRGDGNGYAVFGKVVSGMDVVNKIAKRADRQRRPCTERRAEAAGGHRVDERSVPAPK